MIFQICEFLEKLVSELVILLQFMAMNIYQEAHVLSHQDHALCGKYGMYWYTV